MDVQERGGMDGTFLRIFQTLREDADMGSPSLDSTSVKAHSSPLGMSLISLKPSAFYPMSISCRAQSLPTKLMESVRFLLSSDSGCRLRRPSRGAAVGWKYRINRRPSQLRKLRLSGQYAVRKAEYRKSSARAKVEHVLA
jgi:hypothetical protein